MKNILKIEFHCHTIFSPDSISFLEGLIEAAQTKGIDRLVITDHNTIRGAVVAKQMAPELIIIGEEVRTSKGDMIGVFVKEEVPRGLSPARTIELLRSQDAFIIAAHPFDRYRSGWEMCDLLEILPHVDAIEIFNALCISPEFNTMAGRFAAEYGVPGVVGSDAHAVSDVGRAAMFLPYFEKASELRQVIPHGTHQAARAPFGSRFASVYARTAKQLFRKYGDYLAKYQ